MFETNKKIWGGSVFPLLLTSLSNFEFFFAFIILEILTGHKKKSRESFYALIGKTSEKKKKMYGVEVCFHCS